MNAAHGELIEVLRETRNLLALPRNDFVWSGWDDAVAGLAELDRHIAVIESGRLPARLDLDVLFAPTGPIQEVSASSGWGSDFLTVAAKFDAAAARAYT